jgi:hypothetical protein
MWIPSPTPLAIHPYSKQQGILAFSHNRPISISIETILFTFSGCGGKFQAEINPNPRPNLLLIEMRLSAPLPAQ